MKNKKLLVLTVLAGMVWAMIGYRIYDYLTSVPEVPMASRRSIIIDSEKVNNYQLFLDYKDPFLKVAASPLMKVASQNPSTRKSAATFINKPAIAESSINWASIKFLGSMDNATRKSRSAIILIGKTEYFLREGESVDGFKVVKIFTDSAEIQNAAFRKLLKR